MLTLNICTFIFRILEMQKNVNLITLGKINQKSCVQTVRFSSSIEAQNAL